MDNRKKTYIGILCACGALAISSLFFGIGSFFGEDFSTFDLYNDYGSSSEKLTCIWLPILLTAVAAAISFAPNNGTLPLVLSVCAVASWAAADAMISDEIDEFPEVLALNIAGACAMCFAAYKLKTLADSEKNAADDGSGSATGGSGAEPKPSGAAEKVSGPSDAAGPGNAGGKAAAEPANTAAAKPANTAAADSANTATDDSDDAAPATAKRQPAAPQIECLSGELTGAVIDIEDRLTIGRDPARCNLILSEPQIEGLHCAVRFDAHRELYLVTDFSAGGTFADGNRLARNIETEIERGSRLTLAGKAEFILR